jgi:hypothetical protein
MPPSRGVGILDQREEPVAFRVVGRDTVESQQVGDVTLLEGDPPEFQPADLRLRGPDDVARLLSGKPLGLPKAPKLCADQHANDRWPCRRRPACVRWRRHVYLRTSRPIPRLLGLGQGRDAWR